MEDKIFCGNGILDQIKETDFEIKVDPWSYYYTSEHHLKAIDVGEYSVFVKEDLSEVKGIRVYNGKEEKLLESQEILPSEKGSMIYFDSKVAGIIKPNHKFRAFVYRSWWEMMAGYFWDETMYK